MARLLDDLLDVSRLATGKVELKRERMDLRVVVEQAIESVRPSVAVRRHVLEEADAGREPLWMNADPARILQILINLLSNAVKYTDPGGKIRVAVEREGNDALVRVTDTGIGFSPAMRAGLFTLFAQETGAVNRSAGGLGIGLALVREFVQRHSGEVDAESAGPGLGSTFSVRLPLEPVPTNG
jgi:signal transduction histidine kinase